MVDWGNVPRLDLRVKSALRRSPLLAKRRKVEAGEADRGAITAQFLMQSLH